MWNTSILCWKWWTILQKKTEIYLLVDFNIDWLSENCSLKSKLRSMADTCGLIQLISQATRVSMNLNGVTSSTCIDHIYSNNSELCSRPVSVPVGFSNHNFVAFSRKTKLPKAGAKVVLTRNFKHFNKKCLYSWPWKYIVDSRMHHWWCRAFSGYIHELFYGNC